MTDNKQAPWPLYTDRDGKTPRPEHNGCFATSYNWQHLEHSVCLREELQTVQRGINLSQGLGLVSTQHAQRFNSQAATYLQNPGPLAFSVYIGARQDCPAVCAIQIQLQTEQGEQSSHGTNCCYSDARPKSCMSCCWRCHVSQKLTCISTIWFQADWLEAFHCCCVHPARSWSLTIKHVDSRNHNVDAHVICNLNGGVHLLYP